jgi:UDP-apiose/xylose synthase
MSDTAPQTPPLRLCILGCSGFIGSHLTKRLLDDGTHEIIGVDVVKGKVEDLIGRPHFAFRELDASDENALRPIVEECDAIVHLAAICNPSIYNKQPSTVIDANYTHVLPTVRLCRETTTRLVFFSTCEVYGKTPAAIVRSRAGDEAPYVLSEDASHLILGPVGKQRWTYACAKQLAERIIYAEGQENGLDFTIVRPFNFIGPRMDYLPGLEGTGIPRVFPIFMQALLEGAALPLVDGGHNRRTFIHISEAVDACVRIIERPAACRGEIINIGNPQNECSIAALARLMADLYERKTGIVRGAFKDVDSLTFYGEGYDDCDRRVPDIAKAQRLLGWRPSMSLEDVFSSSMDYYIDTYGDAAR